MDEELLTRSQVAKALDVSPERVRQLTTSGLLPCTVTPLGRLYQRRDVDRVAAVRRRRAVDAAVPAAQHDRREQLVALRPIESRTFETKVGTSEATVARTVVIGDGGAASDLGERPVFWQVVRRQLTDASPEVPWVVGRLVQSGQAYRLDELTDTDVPLVRHALAGLTN